jgi:hypothetical protein
VKKFILVIVVMATGISALAQNVKTQILVAPPQGVYISLYQENWLETSGGNMSDIVNTNLYTLDWQNGQGGSGSMVGWGGWVDEDYSWAATSWPQVLPWGTITYPGVTATNACYPPGLGTEHCNTSEYSSDASQGFWQDTSETADTEMKLATGGPLGSTAQNLWVISASATGYTNLDDSQGYSVPSTQISIGGLGNLDTNGNLYVLLPDNDPDTVTPKVNGNDHYTFNISAQKYTLVATASTNGAAVWLGYGDAPEFCVGQQITFAPAWIPYTPPYSDATADWSLPGTFVNEQSPTCDAYYDENAALLHRDSTTNGTLSTACWFVKDFKGGSASVAVNLTLNDGRQVSLNRSGSLDMYRPTTTFRPTYIGTPQVVANGSLTLYPPMTFAHDVRSDFSGVAGYTQLILVGSDYTDSSPLGKGHILDVGGITPQTELDLGELYYGTQPVTATNGSPAFSDAPVVGYAPTIYTTSMNINLQTYLLFKPNGSGSIFVPLRLVTWGLNDSAQYVNGAWQPSGSATGPNDANTVAFPLWTNTFSIF